MALHDGATLTPTEDAEALKNACKDVIVAKEMCDVTTTNDNVKTTAKGVMTEAGSLLEYLCTERKRSSWVEFKGAHVVVSCAAVESSA